MKRARVLLILFAVVAAFLLLFNPFQGRYAKQRLPAPDAATVARLADSIKARYETPEKYIISAFRSHELVFLGEPGQVRQNVLLVGRLIPELYDAGVRNLGIEYALASDQPEIDRLLAAPTFDEKAVERVLFDYLVVWGFKEYADLFRDAWQLNQSLPAGAPKFRIVGLSVAQDWQYVTSEKDVQDASVVHKIFANGVPDAFMAATIKRSFIDTDEKALIYTNMKSAWTRYVNRDYAENMAKMGFAETLRAGNIVYDLVGGRAMTILFHSPWGARNGAGSYPVDGLIDRTIKALPADERTAGFDVVGSPFATLSMAGSTFTKGYPALTLGDFCDGYVIQGSLGSYQPVTPIDHFITKDNLDLALKLFPGPKPPNVSAGQLDSWIAQSTKNYGRYLASFE